MNQLAYTERKFDSKDPLHRAIAQLGKAANISDFVNGTEVSINPKHPDGKRALDVIKKLMIFQKFGLRVPFG